MMNEYIGYKDPIGNGQYNMGLTDEEIIRCHDCVHWREVPMADGSKGHRCSGVMAFVEADENGFCAWAECDER